MAKSVLPLKLQEWVVARKRFRLSHAHVFMARQLGLNPARLGKIANTEQAPWKAPLPEYIEHLYEKRFGTSRPEVVLSIEQIAEAMRKKKIARQLNRSVNAEKQESPLTTILNLQERALSEDFSPPGQVSETCNSGYTIDDLAKEARSDEPA